MPTHAYGLRLVLVASLLAALGCSPKPTSTPSTTSGIPPTSGTDEPDPGDVPGDDVVEPEPEPEGPAPQRLTVSFGSECCGIDQAAHEALEAAASAFEADHDIALPRTSARWGKEGEIDECFDLAALTPSQRAAFDTKVTQAIGDVRLVTIVRDQPCRE